MKFLEFPIHYRAVTEMEPDTKLEHLSCSVLRVPRAIWRTSTTMAKMLLGICRIESQPGVDLCYIVPVAGEVLRTHVLYFIMVTPDAGFFF